MDELMHAVARNVRALRSARGMSAGALAQASGVGKATLSRIEAGHANPTVETLYALADALGVSFGALAAVPPSRVQVIRAAEIPAIGGNVEVRVVDRLYGAPLVEVLDLVFPAGKLRESGAHPSGVVEHVVLTDGRLRAGPVDDVVELDAGDVLRFGADVPHLYAALDGVPAKAVVLMTYPV
jgi:transcriptional regulator with XRE-family HTH domain